jgi:hypothetical protein
MKDARFDGTQELCRFTHLVALLTKDALADAQPHLDGLTQEILGLARTIDVLQRQIDSHGGAVPDAEPSIMVDAEAPIRAVQHLQISDRLSQRLSNAVRMLLQMATLIENTGTRFDAVEWARFLDDSRAVFTTAEERQAFDGTFPQQAAQADGGYTQ